VRGARSAAVAAPASGGWLSSRPSLLPEIPVSAQQMTPALLGLALYFFVIHSFKVPIASLGIGIGLIGVAIERRGFQFPLPLVLMGLWLLWSTGMANQAANPATTADTLINFLKIFLIFFVAVNASKSLSQLALMCALWCFFFGLYPARGTYFNFFAGIGTFGRYGWNFSFSNYNDLAAYSILVLGVSAFLLAGRFPKWLRFCALASTLLLSLLIIITQSRGAFLALVVAFTAMMVRSRNRRRLIRVGLAGVLLISVAAPGAVWERMKRMKFLTNEETIGEADSSAEQRYVLLKVAYAIAQDHPITGVGLGNYAEVHGQYAETRSEWALGRGNRDTHNLYLNLLAETGIPGALLFLSMLGAVLFRAARAEKRLRVRLPQEAEQLRILRFTLIAYMLAAIFGSFHRAALLYLFLGILWSAAVLFEEALESLPADTGRPAPGSAPAAAPVSRRRWNQHVLRPAMQMGRRLRG
jgi:O-antigen ligase